MGAARLSRHVWQVVAQKTNPSWHDAARVAVFTDSPKPSTAGIHPERNASEATLRLCIMFSVELPSHLRACVRKCAANSWSYFTLCASEPDRVACPSKGHQVQKLGFCRGSGPSVSRLLLAVSFGDDPRCKQPLRSMVPNQEWTAPCTTKQPTPRCR